MHALHTDTYAGTHTCRHARRHAHTCTYSHIELAYTYTLRYTQLVGAKRVARIGGFILNLTPQAARALGVAIFGPFEPIKDHSKTFAPYQTP